MPRSVAVAASLFVSLYLSACGHSAAVANCSSLLENKLTPEENALLDGLQQGDRRSPLFVSVFDSLRLSLSLQERQVAEKALDSHLAGLHSSIDQEAKRTAWRWDRYLRAFARYEDAIGRCQPPRGEPDGAWAEALRKEFGVEQLKRNRRALVGAISVAHFRQLGTCTAAVRLELFEAERSYQSGVISSLREAVDFFTSVKVLPAGKNAELSHRAEILASVLRKLSIERLEHVDTAEIEMEAEKLPSDLSAALSRQSALSKPFDLVEMIHVLNRTLEKP